MMLSALAAGAQENAQYRIAYDCDAQYGPQRQVYRWHLDIGVENAVFYNPSNRGREQVMNEVTGINDVTAVMERIKSIKTQFPNSNPLEVLVSAAPGSKYTYRNKVGGDMLWYEEERPVLSWEMTDRDSTVCGYACLQAKTRLYGRDWTVWFAPEIPLSYGPHRFKFVVDGVWCCDSGMQMEQDALGNQNNVIMVSPKSPMRKLRLI